MQIRFWIIISLFIGFNSRALGVEDACSTVPNLARGLGPAYDQADSRWCVAFVAADLITQKLQRMKRLKEGERIHPLSIAGSAFVLQNRAPVDPRAGSIGNLGPVLLSLLEGDAPLNQCKTSELSESVGQNNPVFQAQNAARWKVFKGFLEAKRPRNAKENCRVTDKNLAEIARLSKDSEQAVLVAVAEELITKCTTVIPKMKVEHFPYFRASRIEKNQYGFEDSAELLKIRARIDEALNHGALAGVTVSAKVLWPDAEADAWHGLSVIGRERRGGVCYYQLRNSWGPKCVKYSPPVICDEKDGSIWLKDSDLIRNVGATTVIP